MIVYFAMNKINLKNSAVDGNDGKIPANTYFSVGCRSVDVITKNIM